MNKIDITSTALEKGIDTAKEFLEKLIGPTVEETGLLIKDKVTFWRFKNQVRMINRANEFCIKNKISPKSISLKYIAPIVEYSGLEDDDSLTEKWAILLSNMVDSDQNIENHVFPHLLSQLSKNEFEIIETAVNTQLQKRKELKLRLDELEIKITTERDGLNAQIKELENEIKNIGKGSFDKTYVLQSEKWKIEKQVRELTKDVDKLKAEIKAPPFIFSSSLEEFEIANLIRLGIVKSISRQYAYVGNSRLSFNSYEESVNLDDIEIHIEQDYEDFIITQLGELFIDVCTEKNKKST